MRPHVHMANKIDYVPQKDVELMSRFRGRVDKVLDYRSEVVSTIPGGPIFFFVFLRTFIFLCILESSLASWHYRIALATLALARIDDCNNKKKTKLNLPCT